MSTGSLSDDAEELPEMELRGLRELAFPGLSKRRPSVGHSSAAEEEEEEEEEEEVARKKKRSKGPSVGKRASASCSSGEGKQSQRNAANARERARMRVLSKAFSRLKTSLPWVPPDTKLSKLDTLRLASSYIAHLRQLLHEDHRYEKGAGGGYVHPVNLTWPFVVSGRPESDTKEVSATNRLCGTTA